MTVRRALANAGLVIALAEGTVSLAAGAASELTWHQLWDGFVVSNTILGLSLALAGYPIARFCPANLVGWLLVGGGICYAFSGAGFAVLAWRTEPGESAPGWRILADLTSLSWPLAVGAVLPLTLLFFPDGRLLSPRWRVAVVAALFGAVVFELVVALGTLTTTSALGVRGYLRLAWVDDPSVIGPIAGATWYGALGAGLFSLFLHYRRGDDRRRRQVLWLLLAALVMAGTFLLGDLAHLESWFNIFVIALVPFAIAVAILRHQLLDIRLVVSRSVLYLAMTGLVVGAYLGIVAGSDRALAERAPLGPPVLATMVIAVAFTPVRRFLQRQIDRGFYGERHDPVRAVAQIGSTLGQTGLGGVLESLCTSLRFPWAAIDVDGETVAAYGQASGPAHVVPLALTQQVVRLTVGLRRGEQTLARRDKEVLALVTGSVSVAVQATQYADELSTARNALVTAREEERRRLGRDLHDGVGPVLTGVTLQADTARRLIETDPAGAGALLSDLRRQTSAAIEEIRRLAQELRPPALDSLGLVGALEQQATMLAPLDVQVFGRLPPLPAAVEVAAYRIAMEALTNVVRHSAATSAEVRLDSGGALLRLSVTDNGRPVNGAWVGGVGLTSMRERATELGGDFLAGPDAEGGRVEVTLPCGGLT